MQIKEAQQVVRRRSVQPDGKIRRLDREMIQAGRSSPAIKE